MKITLFIDFPDRDMNPEWVSKLAPELDETITNWIRDKIRNGSNHHGEYDTKLNIGWTIDSPISERVLFVPRARPL